MATVATSVPTFEEVKAFHPKITPSTYGLSVFMSETEKEPGYHAFHARHARRQAQPVYQANGNRRTLLGTLLTASDLLHHSSEKIQAKTRKTLFEVAERARALALAEGTEALDGLIEDLAAELRALMLIKAA